MTLALEPTLNDRPLEITNRSATSRRFTIPGDDCNKATEHLPEEPRNLIRWFHHHAWTNDIPLSELATMLRRGNGETYSANTVYKILKGKHEADLDNFVDSVRTFKKLTEERATITRIDFVETRLSKRVFGICEAAKLYQTIEFMVGESQIGKSENLLEYARRNNHGSTVYWRLPAGAPLRRSVEELAISCRFSPQQRPSEILRRAVRFFSPEMLLIVDEGHQMFLDGKIKVQVVELIREIYDRCKVPTVISATPTLAREFKEGGHKEFLQQMDLRSLGMNLLPSRPDAGDLDKFAAHYGLPSAKTNPAALDLQTRVIQQERLGRWLKRLMAASRIASKANQKLTWAHVHKADASIAKRAKATLD